MLVVVAVAAVMAFVRPANAEATCVTVKAEVAVKVRPLTVAFWPAAKAENVNTDFSAAVVLDGATAKVAASSATDV